MLKSGALLVFAVLIDLMQAGISAGFLLLGTMLGTTGGAVGGAIFGQNVCSWAGETVASWCMGVGAAAGGFFGSAANVPLAAVGVPLGIGLGFAASVCISFTFGLLLIIFLWRSGMFYPSYVLTVFVGEAIPGIDIVPGWTLLVIRSIMTKSAKEKKGVGGMVAGAALTVIAPGAGTATLLGRATQSALTMKGATGAAARTSSLVSDVYASKPVQRIAESRQQLVADVGQEIRTNPSEEKPPAAGRLPLYA